MAPKCDDRVRKQAILYIVCRNSRRQRYGASYPYNGRYYLVLPDLWEKEQGNYCMVHDSCLPEAWEHYQKNGMLLLEENECPGRITNEILAERISCLDPETLELFDQ